MLLKNVLALFCLSPWILYASGLQSPTLTNTGNNGFLENKGQIVDEQGKLRPDILFITQSKGIKVFIGKQGFYYMFSKLDTAETLSDTTAVGNPSFNSLNLNITTYRLDVKLLGSNPNPKVVKDNTTGYYENYYLAHCPEGITGVKAFEKITLEEVYPGIDWVLYKHGDFMKYDFVVQPGADPSLIKLEFDGATELQLQEDGSLYINTPLGSIKEEAPLSKKNGEEVFSKFRLIESVLSFEVESSKSDLLIIDPIIEWGTYYDSGNSEFSFDSDTDNEGNVYLAGTSFNPNGSISHGGHQNSHGGGLSDAFLVKFDSTGKRLWATYYGGTEQDWGFSCSTDPHHNIYMAGITRSLTAISFAGHQMNGNPTPPTYYSYDGFLVKFNAQGIRKWGTYYGGNGNDRIFSCGTDKSSNVFLVGETSSASNISFNGFKNNLTNTSEAFIVKFDSLGTRQWETYFSANSTTNAFSAAADHLGNIFLYGEVSGSAGDTGLAYKGYQNSIGGAKDVYIAKFNPSGNRVWSTYFGGQDEEILTSLYTSSSTNGISVDKMGNCYISGSTKSSAGIASSGFQNSLRGDKDCFLAKFSGSGSLEWSTYYGGPSEDLGHSCAVDKTGKVFLAGTTSSSTGISHKGFQNSIQGNSDGFLAQFDNFGNRQWATYMCGEDDRDEINCVVTDINNNIYVSGITGSKTGIAFKGFQNSHNFNNPGNRGAFLIKLQGCSTNSLDTISACNSFYWQLKDTTHTISGIYSDTTLGSKGCDSLVQIYLNIYRPTQTTLAINACEQYTWPPLGKIYFTNARDTAFLQSTHGCDSMVILNLTIHKSSNSSLIDTACISYTSPSGKFTWTQSGIYTDTIANAQGCDSIININLNVKEVETGVVQSDSSLTAKAQRDSYQWLNCNSSYSAIDGENKAQFQPLFNGSYAVAVTQNGCTDTSACFAVTGKESLDNPFGIQMAIFPNPTYGMLNVVFSEPVEKVRTAIWNSAGKIISTQDFNTTDRFTLDIRWAAGVYYLKVSNVSGKSVLVKIVKI